MMTTFAELSRYEGTGFFDTKTQLKDYVYRISKQYFDKGKQEREKIQSPKQLAERQKRIRNHFLVSIGGLPASAEGLEVKTTGIVDYKLFSVEKILFQSRKDCFVTANLYKPNTREKSFPAVLFLCGHDKLAKHSVEYQTACREFVKKGFIVLAIDPIGQGERLSYYDKSRRTEDTEWGTAEHSRAGFQCLMTGKPIARYFLHDAMRAVDYLCSRDDVMQEKIAVTGNSGGGTQTAMMMMVDERIAAAAPGTFITTREENLYTGLAQDSEQCWPGMLAKCGFDHQDIALCFAPKPLMILSAKSDFFPYEGTKEVLESSRRFWEYWDKQEYLKIFSDHSTHCYTARMAEKAADFFAEVFHTEQTVKEDIPEKIYEVNEYHQLLCTAGGQINDSPYPNKTIFEENLEILRQMKKKQDKMNWLKERLFQNRVPVSANPRFVQTFEVKGLTESLWVQNLYWFSQKQVLNHGFLFRKKEAKDELLPLTISVWQDGTKALLLHQEWIENECAQNRAVLVLNVTGMGAVAPHPVNLRSIYSQYGTLYKLSDDLNWMDDSLSALRSFDVLRCIETAKQFEGINSEEKIRLYTEGLQGIYAFHVFEIIKENENIELNWVNRPKNFSDFCQAKFYDVDRVWEWILPGMLNFLN